MAGNNTQFLLDTNILLAALIAPDTLPAEVQAQLSEPANSILFSAASIWEIAIKCSLGREDFNFRPEDIQQLALETGHRTTDHVQPLPPHHRPALAPPRPI